jgi:hypothetical protein
MFFPSALRCAALPLWLLLTAASAQAQQSAIGEVFSSEASVRGSVMLGGNGARVLSGSQVTAGDASAVLKLERGGRVRICPHTDVSLNSDASGKSLVLGMNAGAVELDYTLLSSSDSVLTPDFRLQLISPGDFHFALSVAASGDTCLHSLSGNDAAIFVAEMMGIESYQLTPGRSVLFKAGKISGATEAPPNCGCQAPIAAPEAPKPAPTATVPAAQPEPVQAKASAPANPSHLEADTEFVYHGKNHERDFAGSVARLASSHDDSRLALALIPQIKPPATAAAKPTEQKKPGLLQRIAHAFSRVFGR